MNIRIARRPDLPKIAELSEICYPKGYESDIRTVQKRYYRDHDCYVVATDREDRPIAYICYFGISKYHYDRLLSVANHRYYGEKLDVLYMAKNSGLLQLHSVAIHPAYRDGDIILALGRELDRVKEGKRCVAEVINRDGVKFVEHHGFIMHKSTENGCSVYRFPNKY